MFEVVELESPAEPLLLPWLDLYETAFPAAERVLVSEHLRLLHERAAGGRDEHLLALVGEGRAFQGLARWHLERAHGVAWLWYLATLPEVRGGGLGGRLYDHVAAAARGAGADLLLLEVEAPGRSLEPDLARRRIGFYERRGARLLEGVRYTQHVGPHQPPVEMHLMVQPFTPLEAAEVLARLAPLLGEALERVGEPRLRRVEGQGSSVSAR